MLRRAAPTDPRVRLGALAALLAVVAVVLAVGADGGARVARAYDVRVQVRTGQDVLPGDDVRLGGVRAGRVADVVPTVDPRTGRIHATLRLRLDPGAGALPLDSTVLVRPRSALGPNGVELVRGRSRRALLAGGTLSLRQERAVPLELGEAGTADPTARDRRRVGRELGDAVAGRGAALGPAIGELRGALERLGPVMGALEDPGTGLDDAIGRLRRTAGEAASAARSGTTALRGLDGTLDALAPSVPARRDAIPAGLALEDALARRLPATRPSLRRSGRLLRDLRPGLRALRVAGSEFAAALVRGTDVLPRLPALATRLDDALASVDLLARDPRTARSLDAQGRAATLLRPVLRELAPAQVRCNAITRFGRNLAGHLAEGNRYGTWQRVLPVLDPQGALPAGAPDPDRTPFSGAGRPGAPQGCGSRLGAFAQGGPSGNVPGTGVDRDAREGR